MIRTRLALWNTLVLALVLTVLGAIVYSTSRSNLYGTIDADLSERVGFLERNWEEIRLRPRPMDRRGEPPEGRPGFGLGRGPGRGRGPGGPGGPGMGLGMPPPMEGPFPGPDRGVSPEHAQRMEFLRYLMRPRVVTPEGEGFMFDSDTPWDRESMARSLAGERVFSVTTVGEEPVRVLSVPLRVGGRIVAVAQSAESLRESDTIMAKQRRTLLMLLPLALLLTLATGIYLTRLALKPVESIARAAERIEATSLHGRLPVRGKDEFAVLATTFNSMLSRLESSFARLAEAYEAQRRFISDASHELKTPLTAIKTRVGVARRGTHTPERYREHLAAIGVSADTMTAIVQDLLLLAKSDEGRLELRKTCVPLVTIVDEAVLLARRPDHASIERDIPAELDVFADPPLLNRVLVNLLSNAVRHTPAEGTVRIVASEAGCATSIVVSDSGEGIPPEHLARIFDRFHRVDTARDRESGGTGLGLAIAKSIVEAHHGRISLASELGKGTTVTISLPSPPLEERI